MDEGAGLRIFKCFLCSLAAESDCLDFPSIPAFSTKVAVHVEYVVVTVRLVETFTKQNGAARELFFGHHTLGKRVFGLLQDGKALFRKAGFDGAHPRMDIVLIVVFKDRGHLRGALFNVEERL